MYTLSTLFTLSEYTEECLQKPSEPQVIARILSQRDKNKDTIESLRDISIVKTVDNLLMKKPVDIKQQS